MLSAAGLELAERQRALIAAATVEHVERNGRTFLLRRLPSAPPAPEPVERRRAMPRAWHGRVVA